MTIDADPSSRRSAPASFGAAGRAAGTSHHSLAANFFESVRSVRDDSGDDAMIRSPRSSFQLALHAQVSSSMALGTVAATVCAIALAVATFGA